MELPKVADGLGVGIGGVCMYALVDSNSMGGLTWQNRERYSTAAGKVTNIRVQEVFGRDTQFGAENDGIE